MAAAALRATCEAVNRQQKSIGDFPLAAFDHHILQTTRGGRFKIQSFD